MNSPNTEIVHDLTKTILREWHHYHGVSRDQYDEVYTESHNAIRQILDWGVKPDKLKPILVNMWEVEGSLFKRGEAVSRLWCVCANYIKLWGETNWTPWNQR